MKKKRKGRTIQILCVTGQEERWRGRNLEKLKEGGRGGSEEGTKT